MFIFQGVWNVAAAFCGHENATEQATTYPNHFGHHQSVMCESEEQKQTQQQNINLSKTLESSANFLEYIQDDHHDHLPSFAHFIMVELQQKTKPLCWGNYIQKQIIDRDNLYKSPHLKSLNPPPELVPLLVG
ncbi:hypothetical protein EC844_10345 [Acinetobacter calcoaceticus]|uniref:Cation transporter n=1 Tax=Acinetobacter calcoaceticus TaxID=471 RepID=A0A4R1Y0K0_ACICA|nr:hypothetical protein EC844_10345 [Acinetobacter calcoaceticus]